MGAERKNENRTATLNKMFNKMDLDNQDRSLHWDKPFKGEVTKVEDRPTETRVFIKSTEPFKEGDKLGIPAGEKIPPIPPHHDDEGRAVAARLFVFLPQPRLIFLMTNTPDDAPNLLHKNPESTYAIAEPFMNLYRQARRQFSHEVLTSTATDSAWDAALRPKWSPAEHNPIRYEGRLSKLISRSWDEVRPTVQEAAPYIEADPSLLDVHSGLAHTFDVQKGQVMPERVALFNLRLWISQSLHRLWDNRLTGEAAALFAVRQDTVQLKGLVPEPMLGALSPSHNLPDKGPDRYADCQRHPASSHA